MNGWMIDGWMINRWMNEWMVKSQKNRKIESTGVGLQFSGRGLLWYIQDPLCMGSIPISEAKEGCVERICLH